MSRGHWHGQDWVIKDFRHSNLIRLLLILGVVLMTGNPWLLGGALP
ncbi:MAG: hypothetical protein R3276_13995 [Marinobacter sp.]|nr:hypothetical protein [Marinobacter sp.]